MANIVFITDAFQSSGGGGGYDDDPGGSTPVGNLDWLESKIYTESFGLLGGSSTFEGEVGNMLLSAPEQQIIWPRTTDYYYYQRDLLYEVTDQDFQSLAKTYANTALAPFTIGAQVGAARLWRSGSTRRILVPGGTYYPGSNPLVLASVDLASGQLHTGLTKAQINTNLGLTADNQYCIPAVSPDGTKLVVAFGAGTYSAPWYLTKLTLDGADQIVGIEQLGPTVEQNTLLVAASNNAFYTAFNPTSSSSPSSQLQRRSLTTGEVTHTIAPPDGWWGLSGWWNNAKVVGGSLFIFGEHRNLPGVNKLYLWKISLSSHEVVGKWDLSDAPQSSFDSELNAPYQNPETAWKAPSLIGAGFDSSANLWLAFNNDVSRTTINLGNTRYQRDRRIYRVRLS